MRDFVILQVLNARKVRDVLLSGGSIAYFAKPGDNDDIRAWYVRATLPDGEQRRVISSGIESTDRYFLNAGPLYNFHRRAFAADPEAKLTLPMRPGVWSDEHMFSDAARKNPGA